MEREQNSKQNPYSISHHTLNILLHYLVRVESSTLWQIKYFWKTVYRCQKTDATFLPIALSNASAARVLSGPAAKACTNVQIHINVHTNE